MKKGLELRETIREQQGMIFKFTMIEGRFIHTFCDGAMLYKLGFSQEEVVGKELKDFLPMEIALKKLECYKRAWQGEENVFYEGSYNGLTYWASLKPVIRDGKVIEVIASCVDITKLINAKMASEESEEHYRQLIELSPESIAVFSDFKFMYLNPACKKLLGAAEEDDLIGRNVLDFIDPYERETVKGEIERRIKKGTPSDIFEKKLFPLDNRVITVEVRTVPITYLNQPAVQLLIRDITDRKEAEKVFTESNFQYQRLIKFSPEPIFIHENGSIIYANKAGVKLVGAKDEEDLFGMSIYDSIHPDSHEIFNERIQTAIITEQHLDFMEHKLIRLDGQVIDIESSSIYIYKHFRRPVIQTVFRDITERKRAEEMIRRNEKLAVVGQLAAGVAHEIRNPLTALKGFTQLLKSKFNEHHDYFDIMLNELDRINFIVNEFMVIAKPQVIQFADTRLQEILDSVIMILNTQAMIKNVQIISEYDSDVPAISCDANQLKQVFINFIKNSIEATQIGGGEIRIQLQYLASSREVLIRVSDQGVGISEERISKLGEPFYTTKESGTGLGLMVCYKIIEAHQGRISIQSKLNQGTAIEITLPSGG